MADLSRVVLARVTATPRPAGYYPDLHNIGIDGREDRLLWDAEESSTNWEWRGWLRIPTDRDAAGGRAGTPDPSPSYSGFDPTAPSLHAGHLIRC